MMTMMMQWLNLHFIIEIARSVRPKKNILRQSCVENMTWFAHLVYEYKRKVGGRAESHIHNTTTYVGPIFFTFHPHTLSRRVV